MPKKMHDALRRQAKKKGFVTKTGELSKRGRAYVYGPLGEYEKKHSRRKKKC